MTIHIDLDPEVESRLRERAARRGEAPEALATQMLRSLLVPEAGATISVFAPVVENGVFHPDRWERVLASIRANAATPVLPPEALRREAMYEDHD